MLELHRIEVAKGNQMAIKSRCNKKKSQDLRFTQHKQQKITF